MGKATVTIDGVSKGTFDNRSATTRYGAVRTFGRLTDGVHTLRVTVVSGSVAVDRFVARA
jgi:hypothetical protein